MTKDKRYCIDSMTDSEVSNRMACKPKLGALKRLIDPFLVDEFFTSTWERRHLHITGHHDDARQQWLDGIITTQEIDGILTCKYATGRHRADAVRISNGGEAIPLENFAVYREPGFAQVDVGRTIDYYRNGATVVLNNLQDVHEPLAKLCKELAHDFAAYVNVNAYLTPPHSHGFRLHFDVDDTFLIQVLGAKCWSLYEAIVPLAAAVHQQDFYEAPDSLPTTLELKRGDALYLPRGVLHEGKTTHAASLHLTVAIAPYTWSEMLQDIIEDAAREEVVLRRSAAKPNCSPDDLSSEVSEILSILSCRFGEKMRVEAMINRRIREVSNQQSHFFEGLLTRAVCSESTTEVMQ